MENPKATGEYQASPDTQEAGVDLESARLAYQIALENIMGIFPQLQRMQPDVVERKEGKSLVDILNGLLFFLISPFRIFAVILQGIWFVIRQTAEDLGHLIGGERAIRSAAKHSAEAHGLQNLLLELLWSRDYVQYLYEQPEPVPYHIKRNTLHYLLEHDDLLDEARRLIIERADLDSAKLRKAQPTPPPPEAWWWYLDNRRVRRAQRLNAFWFVLAMFPALAGIILITLYTQRLAVNGLDVLSGASAMAQIILGGGSILAGRELLNSFFFDRSSGRSWQGEITFVLATVFLVVIVTFYLLVPPAAADIYNWFGQRSIQAGNAAEAELYLESATRLDPDPHAANLVEVGCLYLTLGSSDRAENVFERGVEADSRLLVARYHLAEIYIETGNYTVAQQLLEDGIDLLSQAQREFVDGETNDPFLPEIDDEITALQVEYLLRLSLGHAYLEAGTFQQAKLSLSEAATILETLQTSGTLDKTKTFELPCAPDERMAHFIDSLDIDLLYFQARTLDGICQDSADNGAAVRIWREIQRFSPSELNSRQESYRSEADTRLTGGITCFDL